MPSPAIVDLRTAVLEMAAAAVHLPDEAMGREWAWGDYNEEGLRFALLMAVHALRDLSVETASAAGPQSGARRILARFAEANASLEGLVLSAGDGELDRAPAAGEWPLREVLKHILQSEHGFGKTCERGLGQRRSGAAPSPMTNRDFAAFGPFIEPQGDVAAVLAALVRSREAIVEAFKEVGDADLDAPVYFWESEPLPLRFRLIRFELHMLQHTVQAEKTMAGIGHPPSEAERLVRLLVRGLGEVEGAAIGASRDATPAAAIAATKAIRVLTAAFS